MTEGRWFGMTLLFILVLARCPGIWADQPDPPDVIEMASSVFGLPRLGEPGNGTLMNGNFEVIKNDMDNDTPYGDGIDEVTLWVFDFSKHEDIEHVLNLEANNVPTYRITRASLTLVVSPMAETARTDAVYIQGSACNWVAVRFFTPPGLEDAALRRPTIIEYDLIDDGFFWADALHWYFRLSGKKTVEKDGFHFGTYYDTVPGQLPMIFRDDSIISYASLILLFEKRVNAAEDSRMEEEADLAECECATHRILGR